MAYSSTGFLQRTYFIKIKKNEIKVVNLLCGSSLSEAQNQMQTLGFCKSDTIYPELLPRYFK